MNRIYHNPYGSDNMRFIDFKCGKSGSPYTFTICDYQKLKESHALVARKFSIDKDSQIIEKIFKETAL